MLHARAGVMLGLRFMADVLQGIAGAGGERDEHRGTALALTQAGGRAARDRCHADLAALVPAAHEPGGHVAAGVAEAQPGWAGPLLDALGEGFWLEGGSDPGADGVEIDPDGR